MILNVPLIRQKRNSVSCGIMCVRMVLKYYGINESTESIMKEVNLYKIGTYVPQRGIYLIKKGFDVQIINMNPMLFTKKEKGKNSVEILGHLKKIYKEMSISKNKKDWYKHSAFWRTLKLFVKFLEMGGELKVKIPEKRDIEKEVYAKRPLIASLTSNFLKGSKPIFNFHANVIIGIDNKYVYVNDPLSDIRGGKNKYLIEEFLFGLYASSYGDPDNGSLSIVKRK